VYLVVKYYPGICVEGLRRTTKYLSRNTVTFLMESDYRRVSGMITGFIGHFDTARDYTVQFTITHTNTSVHNYLFTAVVWSRLPTEEVPLAVGFRTVPMPQLHAFKSNSSQRLNRSSSLTNSPTNSRTA
jgi:hypothetical protein